MIVISVNGPDKAGKTTQIELLRRRRKVNLINRFFEYNDAWPVVSPSEFERWWFHICPTNAFVQIVEDTYVRLATQTAAEIGGDVPTIMDRGFLMYKADCIALLMLREKLFYEDAERLARNGLRNASTLSAMEYSVFFRPCERVEHSVQLTLSRLGECSEEYRKYQEVFQRVLYRQADDGCYDYVLDVHGMTVEDMQERFLRVVSGAFPF